MYDSFKSDIGRTRLGKIIKRKNAFVLLTAIAVFLFGMLLLVPIALAISSMDGDLFSAGNMIAIVIPLAIVGTAFYGFYLFYKRSRDLYEHPDIKKFLSFGDGERIIEALEDDLNGPPTMSSKGVFGVGLITKNFVARETTYRFRWAHASEIVWAYRKQIDTKLEGAIPIESTSNVVIHTSDGGKMEIEFNGEMELFGKKGRANANLFLGELQKIAPDAIYGYSGGVAKRWAMDRQNLISEVRRGKWKGDHAKPAASPESKWQ